LTEEDVEGGEVDSIAQRLTQMVHEVSGCERGGWRVVVVVAR
jgi:hypothetical protein